MAFLLQGFPNNFLPLSRIQNYQSETNRILWSHPHSTPIHIIPIFFSNKSLYTNRRAKTYTYEMLCRNWKEKTICIHGVHLKVVSTWKKINWSENKVHFVSKIKMTLTLNSKPRGDRLNCREVELSNVQQQHAFIYMYVTV